MTQRLTDQDVARLLSDPSASGRADLAGKVAIVLQAQDLNSQERKLAGEIVQALARDVAVRVRKTLADTLRHSSAMPREVALRLATDVETIALPILQSTPVLTDDDLITIVRGGDSARQNAIAQRAAVSFAVSDVLVETGDATTVATLMGNTGADISEATLGNAIDRFGDDANVQDAIVHRPALPVTVAERLVAHVSAQLQDYLATHHELPGETACDLVMQSRERTLMSFVSDSGTDGSDIDSLVRQLHSNGRLTPSLILRALCLGDMAFFEAAVARLGQVPVVNARILIHDAGTLGLKSLLERAGLPVSLLPAVRVAINVADETDFDGEPGDRERRRRRMLERILTQFEELRRDDLNYLMSKLSDLDRETVAA